jgi:epoxyqueuosine reductase QueG
VSPYAQNIRYLKSAAHRTKGLLQYRIGRFLRQAQLESSPVTGTACEKRAGRLAGLGSMWRLADSQHGSDQIV